MATYDPLFDSRETLMIAAVAVLTDAGYIWDQKTTSFSEYLATALTGIGGSTVSNKTMSITQLLAGLVNELGSGPVSHLTSSYDQLLAFLANATVGPTIELSNASFPENSALNTVIGTLSVSGGTGTYTYTFTSNPGTLFNISGSDLRVTSTTIAAGSYPVTIQADNGAGSVVTRQFLLTATASTNTLQSDTGVDILADTGSPILVQ